MKILLTDIYFRKSFDIINILKRHYHPSCFIYTAMDVTLYSRLKANLIYGAKTVQRLRKNDNFKQDLLKISTLFEDEEIVFIPIEESTTLIFMEFLSDTIRSHNFKFLLPNSETFLLSRNKEELNIFCEESQIPSPKYISRETFNLRTFRFPIIIKPKHGSGAKGIIYVEDEEGLKSQSIDFDNFFVQERLPNSKEVEAGFYLCDKGEIISSYSHKRIRTYPETGGVTVFSKSSSSPDIKQSGETIIQKLNWSGLLMIEFIFDKRDNRYKLIEINPRLWGSIMLSEFCGAEFLKKYVDISMDNVFKKSKIRNDIFIRWIFPYDIIYWFKHLSNPFNFFKKNSNTCYINFTYSNFLKSLIFVSLTYFSFSKITKLFCNEK